MTISGYEVTLHGSEYCPTAIAYDVDIVRCHEVGDKEVKKCRRMLQYVVTNEIVYH